MYKKYFGFIKEPFNITPDPDFFYCSKIHEEILEVIEYQLKKRRGYVVLTGEVGTGKTLLCKTLINKLTNFYISYIINPFLTPKEILVNICRDFGIEIPNSIEESVLFDRLKEFLIKIYKEGKNALVIVDEAQNLNYETFEILRQISNIELDEAKLIQIILVGQQELIEKLNKKELRQLNQRISVILELKPLTKEETENYINFRVQEALKYKRYIFTKGAINKIYQYTNGIPREINQISEIALLVAYSKQKKKVTKQEIIDAAKEYYNKKALIQKKRSLSKYIVILLFIIATGLIYYFYFFDNLFYSNLKENVIDNISIKKQDNSSLNKNKINIVKNVNYENDKNIRDKKIITIVEINDNKTNNKKKKDNMTTNIITKSTTINENKTKDNTTLNKNIFYDLYIGPISYKTKNMYEKILKKYKISFYTVKLSTEKNYIIHVGFMRNYNNVLKLKNKLKNIGIKEINIKKIEK